MSDGWEEDLDPDVRELVREVIACYGDGDETREFVEEALGAEAFGWSF